LVDRATVFTEGPRCASIQFSLNAFSDNADMLALCAASDLACIIKKPLASGFLTGKFAEPAVFASDDFRSRVIDFNDPDVRRMQETAVALRDVLTSGGRTMAQGAIAWIWARSDRTIPIPGARTEAQVRENAGALRYGPLSPQEFKEANDVLEAFRSEPKEEANRS
jgi:aryl-alcohol dehydrogenase-like predicted oxidoreductase